MITTRQPQRQFREGFVGWARGSHEQALARWDDIGLTRKSCSTSGFCRTAPGFWNSGRFVERANARKSLAEDPCGVVGVRERRERLLGYPTSLAAGLFLEDPELRRTLDFNLLADQFLRYRVLDPDSGVAVTEFATHDVRASGSRYEANDTPYLIDGTRQRHYRCGVMRASHDEDLDRLVGNEGSTERL